MYLFLCQKQPSDLGASSARLDISHFVFDMYSAPDQLSGLGHLSLTVFWLRKNSWTFLFPGYLWISFVTQPLLFRHVCKFGVRSDNTHPPSLRTFAFSECPVEKNLLTNLIRRSFSAPVLLYPTGALQELPFFCRESQDDIAFAKLSNSL